MARIRLASWRTRPSSPALSSRSASSAWCSRGPVRERAVVKAELMASKVMQVSDPGPGMMRAQPLEEEPTGGGGGKLERGGWLNRCEETPAAISSTAKGKNRFAILIIKMTRKNVFLVLVFWVTSSVVWNVLSFDS